MRIKLLSVAFIFIALPVGAYADIGDTLWTRFYGLGNSECPFSIKRTADDGFIIAGWTTSFGYGDKDIYLVKTDLNGDTLWTRKYGGDNDDVAMSVQATADGGYIMAGWTNSYGIGGTDFYVVKTDGSGEVLWTNTFGGPYDDTAKCVQRTTDGAYLVCGTSERNGAYGRNFDVYVVKVNVHGDSIWTYYSGGIVDDAANCIIEANDGSYMLAGSTGDGEGNHNIYVEKINTAGQNVWYQGYRHGPDNQAYSIIQADDENFVIAGYTYNNSNYVDCYLMKIDAGGGIIWDRTFGDSHCELGYSVSQTEDGGYIIGGGKWISFWPDTTLFYLVKTDSEGHRQWDRAYMYGNFDEGASVVPTEDGHYAFVGYSNWLGYFSLDFCLMKIQGVDIVSIDENNWPIPDAFELDDNYPNPFNASTLIKYELPQASQVTLEIYDILGRHVTKLCDNFQQAGYHRTMWNAAKFPSGIYFYRLRAGDYVETKRMMLVK